MCDITPSEVNTRTHGLSPRRPFATATVPGGNRQPQNRPGKAPAGQAVVIAEGSHSNTNSSSFPTFFARVIPN